VSKALRGSKHRLNGDKNESEKEKEQEQKGNVQPRKETAHRRNQIMVFVLSGDD
jgi:Sec-independent protein translocase protein TatA